MVILHIAHIGDDLFSGVNRAVPRHVASQQSLVSVGLLNMAARPVEGVEHLFLWNNTLLNSLSPPFDAPDLAVFHEVYRPAYLKMAAELRKRGIPYVIMPHGCLTKTAQHKKWGKKAAANLLLFNRFVDGAAAIQCLSDRERKATVRGGLRLICPNGTEAPVRKQIFSSSGLRMVYIGRLEVRIKGLDLLLEAVAGEQALLRQQGCTLALYGPEERGARARLRRMIVQAGLEDVVFLHSAVNGAEKEAALLAADCFVQPSRSEGMPMGLLEALACGLPCIATEETGMARLIREHDAGWTCSANVESLAAALRQAVLERSQLLEKSKGASELGASFSWAAAGNIAVAQYRQLLDQQHPAQISREEVGACTLWND